MAVQSAQVPVGTTATSLSGTDTGSGEGYSITVAPAADIFVGGAGVTVANGFKIPAGSAVSLDLHRGEQLFAITGTGTSAVSVLRSGV